ncbi:hypothetical protein ALC53_04726 [Atta colombica]|uniref:Uncharacterized protein n=1 Tax=Atta colombica TaxID=520822 RepID=A0A195BJY3_9HYME|nr:hypothetical protein ALC53_04726 [Atta colombica]
MNGRFFLSLAHPEMRFRDIAELSAGKYDEITVWVRIEEGTRVQKSRSRFVIHIRVSEDKAIKSPRASGCGADSPGLPRRIKLTDPPGTQRGKSMDHQKSGEKIENKVVEKKIKVGMCRRFAKRKGAFQDPNSYESLAWCTVSTRGRDRSVVDRRVHVVADGRVLRDTSGPFGWRTEPPKYSDRSRPQLLVEFGSVPRVSAPADAIARVHLIRFGFPSFASRRVREAVDGGHTVYGKRDRNASKSCYATFRAFPTFRASTQRVLEPILFTVSLNEIRKEKETKRERIGAIFLSRSSRARDSRQLAFVASKNCWSLQKQRISV